MKFFLPDWDDRIDPGYDFSTDRHTYGRDPYKDDLYAHEVFDHEPPYDGILFSRSAMAEHGPKRERIDRVESGRFFRLPPQMEIIGDCGAFGYISKPLPPYSTEDIHAYYARAGADYGISVDHIVVPEFPEERERRYNLTISNAVDFLKLHRSVASSFIPVGAVQGWDAESYIAAAKQLVGAGYTMIALGGLARMRTVRVHEIVAGVLEEIPRNVRVHVLGVARDQLLPRFVQLGVFSFDSASPLRTAWTSTSRNYFAMHRDYVAIRIPFANPVIGEGLNNIISRSEKHIDLGTLERLERHALRSLWAYGQRQRDLQTTVGAIAAYDAHLARKDEGDSYSRRRIEEYRRTLVDRSWEHCPCRVCRSTGIDVVIFRGSNRNRRRGFHNTWTFYRKIRALQDLGHFDPNLVNRSGFIPQPKR